MKAVKVTPTGVRQVDVGWKWEDIVQLIGSTPMTVFEGKAYIIIGSVKAMLAERDYNPAATALFDGAVYGPVLVFGIRNKAWCDIRPETVKAVKTVFSERRKTYVNA